MILGVLSKLILKVVNKGLGVTKVFSEKHFEVRPFDKIGGFVVALILSPSEADGATEIQLIPVTFEVLK